MSTPELTPTERATVERFEQAPDALAECDGGAIALRWISAELPMSADGTGHVADCGYTHEAPECGCATLPKRLADLIARERAEAAREVWRAAAEYAEDECPHEEEAVCDYAFTLGAEFTARADRSDGGAS